jgi:hypothetical protein
MLRRTAKRNLGEYPLLRAPQFGSIIRTCPRRSDFVARRGFDDPF